MNILVCGGAGYIGSHVTLELFRSGYNPIVVDNFSNSDPVVIDRLRTLINHDLRFKCISLNNLNDVFDLFSEVQPDGVIHLAGLKSVAQSVADPIKYYYQNLGITLNILKAMDKYECNNIVFSSSATVYGNPVYFPIDEEHPISPVSPYGSSKYFQEKIIKDWQLVDQNARSAIMLRYFNPVGADKSGLIGENPSLRANNLIPILGELAINQKLGDYVTVFGDDYNTRDGTCERDYIHVSDLAQAHVLALKFQSHFDYEIFNVGTGKGITVLEAISTYSKICGQALPFKIGERRLGDPPSSIASNDKITNYLKWTPKHTFEKSCRDDFFQRKQSRNRRN